MIAASIIFLALVLWYQLRKIRMVLALFGTIFERMANRAAEQRGEPPVTTIDDIKKFT
jgi:hypothetical protein